jgi:sugar lactone lactonase YvrE
VKRLTLVLGLAAVAFGASAVVASAGWKVPGTITVVANGLNNPRQVSVAPSGALYVAEAGKAGGTCIAKDACLGFSGSITRVKDGKATRVLNGLASIGGKDGSFTVGADGVSIAADGSVLVQMTAFPNCGPEKLLPPKGRVQLGSLLVKSGAQGLRPLATVDALECAHNYDKADRNSDPYAVLALSKSSAIVVDAGANALYKVAGGKASLLTVFPKLPNGAQSVPTSIAVGPDGAYYVGELGGETKKGPLKNGARVFRVDPATGKATVFAKGFNDVTGVAFDGDGNLYVTELSIDPTNRQNTKGDVVRVAAEDGARTRLGGGKLMFPAGAAVGADGNLYVANMSVLPGKGQLVRISLS